MTAENRQSQQFADSAPSIEPAPNAAQFDAAVPNQEPPWRQCPRPAVAPDASAPSVSVIIPARNAEGTIAEALESVRAQDYPGRVEVIVADGSDTPAMRGLLQGRYPWVRVVPNPHQVIAPGVNAALEAATGEVVARCDAHTILPPDYLRLAVATLEETRAANVGGRQRSFGTTFFERAVSCALDTLLGTGRARFRVGGPEGPDNTVYLGVFWRKTLDAAGGYDPSLDCAEDYELNCRLRKNGGVVWFDPKLMVDYRARDTLWSLARQYFGYGRWKRVVLWRHPQAALPRHFAAPLLVLGLAGSAGLGWAGAPWLAAALVPVAYLCALVATTLAAGICQREPAALVLPVVLVTMHLSWGLGFFLPLFRTARRGAPTARAKPAPAEIAESAAIPNQQAPWWQCPRPAVAPDASAPSVSVIIPARNAEGTIAEALESVRAQDYPGRVEVIVADGSDTPAMRGLLQGRYPWVRVVPNPHQVIAPGVNAALEAATGEVVARCDAHTILPPDYLRLAVATLEETRAANVGGRQRSFGTTFFERAVSCALDTLLGTGRARFRVGGPEGPDNTVYLGVFWRKTLDAAGGYDPSLDCAEDYELNCRLRKNGGVVWFDPKLMVDYRARDTLWSLARQYFGYGRWKRVVLWRHPQAALPRHFAAPLLVLGLAGSAGLGWAGAPWLAAALVPVAYLCALVATTLAAGICQREPAALVLPVVLVTMHLSWGLGFFLPLFRTARSEQNAAEAPVDPTAAAAPPARDEQAVSEAKAVS